MAYSRKIRNKKNHKKSNKRNNKKKGGSCGCNRILGGSPYLSDLSPQTHYPYNSSIQNDPNNHQLSTRMAGVENLRLTGGRTLTGGKNLTGGRNLRKNKSRKNKKQKKIVQSGGLSYSDFNIMNPTNSGNDAPSFLHNLLSTNQPNPNIPMISPGIKYFV